MFFITKFYPQNKLSKILFTVLHSISLRTKTLFVCKRKLNFLFFLLTFSIFLGCPNKKPEPPIDRPITDKSLLGAWQVNTNDKGIWIYKIGYQDSITISGNKIVYSAETPILIPFVGKYDSTERIILINEKNINNKLAGTFNGKIDGQIKNISGEWKSYEGNISSLSMLKSEKNYNRIEFPYDYEARVTLEFSEAYYNGNFGITKPQKNEITANYKSNIGKTFFLGSFAKNEEIEFYIDVRNTGITYLSGMYDHASVIEFSKDNFKIYFEDSENIDRDFNDLIVQVRTNQIPAPEDRPSEHKVNNVNTGWCYPLKDLCDNNKNCKTPKENITFGFMSYNNSQYPYHLAQDITRNSTINRSYKEGDPVYAMANGKIIKIRRSGSYGGSGYNTMIVQYHYNKGNSIKPVFVLYGHVTNIKNAPPYPPSVPIDEKDVNIPVKKYEKIAELNDPGSEWNHVVHLHLCVMPDLLPNDWYRGYSSTQSPDGRARPFDCKNNTNGGLYSKDWIDSKGNQNPIVDKDVVFFDMYKPAD